MSDYRLIQVLPPVAQSVRDRPAMFFGSTCADGQLEVLWEIVGNAVDQFLGDRNGVVRVTLQGSHAALIEDDGPGFDCDGLGPLLSWLTVLHSTPTRDGHSPHIHIGGRKRGVGLAGVAGACKSFSLTTHSRGHVLSATLTNGTVESSSISAASVHEHGTSIELQVDDDIFPDGWDTAQIHWRLFELACLCPGLTIEFNSTLLHGTLADLLPGGSLVAPFTSLEGHTGDGHRLRMALRKTTRTGLDSSVISYINLAHLPSSGSLGEGLRKGLALNRRRPVQAVVVADLWHPSPRFAGPCRDALDQPEIVQPIAELTESLLREAGL